MTDLLTRTQTRGRLIARSKKDRNGHALCWRCEAEIGAEMHEMVNRAVTVGNPQARALSFQEGLCLLLCRECHADAPTYTVERELWLILYQVYGKAYVYAAYLDVVNATQGTLMFDLPE